MSIFSSLRRSRQQAKEHNAKLAEQKKKEDAQMPYKHIPTHAATDAFASAPPSFREADRPRIVEQNRRRSAMAASGHHMNMPGIPRVGSSLSRVSYPGQDTTVAARLPRAFSYTGVSYNAGARDSREIMYTVPQDTTDMQVSRKGKEVSRVYDPNRGSPTSSKSGPSPTDSSDGSTSSQDDLEMKPSKPKTRPTNAVTTHRLHPNHARRKSETFVTLSSTAKSSHISGHRDSRPPPSMRGFGSIPAVVAMPPTSVGASSGHSLLQGQNSPTSSNKSSLSDTYTAPSRQGSATSLGGHSYGIVKQPGSATVTSHTPVAQKNEHGMNRRSLSGPDEALQVLSGRDAAGPSFPNSGTTTSARARNPTVKESPSLQVHWSQQPTGQSHDLPVAHKHQLVNVFPEMAMTDSPKNSGKSRKLSKGDTSRFSKKNRWSTSKVPAVSV